MGYVGEQGRNRTKRENEIVLCPSTPLGYHQQQDQDETMVSSFIFHSSEPQEHLHSSLSGRGI